MGSTLPLSPARIPRLAAIAAANSVAAANRDDVNRNVRVLRCAAPDTSERSRPDWPVPVGREQRRAVYFNTCWTKPLIAVGKPSRACAGARVERLTALDPRPSPVLFFST